MLLDPSRTNERLAEYLLINLEERWPTLHEQTKNRWLEYVILATSAFCV